MFKFIKEKLGNWIKKSKIELEKKAENVEEPKKQKKSKQTKKEIKKEQTKPGISKDLPAKSKDPAEILSEQPAKEVIKQLEERKKETPKETQERLKEFKKEEVKEEESEQIQESSTETPNKKSFLSKLKSSFSYKITKEDFNDLFEDLELLLLENNVALDAIDSIRQILEKQLIEREIKKSDLEILIKSSLKKTLESLIIEPDDPLEIIKQIKQQGKGPFKIAFLGINGVGKTTTMAKFAKILRKNKISCVFAASDTFRAASIEQLEHHADILKIKVIKQSYGADPAAVAFDAIKYAKAHSIDVVLIDTAGRMHTKDNLLQEMEKIIRVSQPDLKIFVAESIAGNDATEQARAFHESISIDGSILSKADIDEKAGTIISISHATNKPIFYLGKGQSYNDLELFNKEKFIKQLGLD